MSKLIRLIQFSAVAAFLFACAGQPAQTQETLGPEYTSAYVCPMHCEGSGSDKQDTCPVCGMDYELNTESTSN